MIRLWHSLLATINSNINSKLNGKSKTIVNVIAADRLKSYLSSIDRHHRVGPKEKRDEKNGKKIQEDFFCLWFSIWATVCSIIHNIDWMRTIVHVHYQQFDGSKRGISIEHENNILFAIFAILKGIAFYHFAGSLKS